MANEIRRKSRTTITAQASGALTAGYDPSSGSYTGESATTLDNTYDGGSENCLGAEYINLELDVTTAPSTAATAQIWHRTSENGTRWSAWSYSHTVPATIVASTATTYKGGIYELTAQYAELKVMAVSYGFTATLYATPKLPEIQ